ncbi:translation initiation factor IF-2 [Candidatus Cytomitobacter indipagum]|uniref:Translation initiation factor IF-2 n=1 Tax=Candidatus Cytomitobacter indipagum TaxID=2601575 RepID=A0A5C0UD55_9PROT|nr:translation initiation factor IF-2 [Candidatus Cytomitobacter indipagum]QEK37966.1 translation initiation factor IF-2 [Candidatus Cytomitobacter indipagum]
MNYTVKDRNNNKVTVEVRKKFSKSGTTDSKKSGGFNSHAQDRSRVLEESFNKVRENSINRFSSPFSAKKEVNVNNDSRSQSSSENKSPVRKSPVNNESKNSSTSENRNYSNRQKSYAGIDRSKAYSAIGSENRSYVRNNNYAGPGNNRSYTGPGERGYVGNRNDSSSNRVDRNKSYVGNDRPPRKVNFNQEAIGKVTEMKRDLLKGAMGSSLNPLNKILNTGEKKTEFRTYTPNRSQGSFNRNRPDSGGRFGPGNNRFSSGGGGFGGNRFNNNGGGFGGNRFNNNGGGNGFGGNRFNNSGGGGGFGGNRFNNNSGGGFNRPGNFHRKDDSRPSFRPGSESRLNAFKLSKGRAFIPSDKKPFQKSFSSFAPSFMSKSSEGRKFATKKKFFKQDGDKKQNRFRQEEGPSEERFSHQFLGKINSAEDIEIDSNMYFNKRFRNSQRVKDAVVRNVEIPFEGIDPMNLANQMAVKLNVLHAKLESLDLSKSDIIEPEMALIIVEEMGHKAEVMTNKDMEIIPDVGNEDDYEPRCPIVTIVGHVDHGKTSLLDALRKTNIVSGESGGITQAIGASQVFLNENKFVTFVDTPGHEAFTSMRVRGVEITDIVVLVIAADDGIKDQTVEAIQHIQNAKVPFIVCYTKIDKPDSNIDNIRQKLLIHNIVVESMSGEILEVEVSAMKNKNLDKLLEMLLLQAEMLELRGNNKCKASGIVIESRLDRHKGPVATVLIKNGKLDYADHFIVGDTYGKIRNMTLPNDKKTKSATTSIPVEIMGLNDVPSPGDLLIEVDSEKEARSISEYRVNLKKRVVVKKKEVDILAYFNEEKAKNINLIVKADVAGSLEAIVAAVSKIEYESIDINVVGKGNGALTDSDVLLAKTSDSTIICFKVNIPSSVAGLAKEHNIKIKRFSVIYELIDYVKSMAEGILAPTEEEKILGTAVIKEIFVKKKIGTIAGCGVEEGIIKVKTKGRVIRNGKEIYIGDILSLKQRQYDKVEIPANQECGIIMEGFTDFHIGDQIESFIIKNIAKKDIDE